MKSEINLRKKIATTVIPVLSLMLLAPSANAFVCVATMVDALAPPASMQISMPINTAFKAYDFMVANAASVGIANIQSAATEANLSTMNSILKTSSEAVRSRYKMSASALNLRMGMRQKIADLEEKERNALVVGESSLPQNKPFFTGIVKAGKLSQVNSLHDANSTKLGVEVVGGKLEKETATTGTNAQQRIDGVRTHYMNYCDSNGYRAGYCSEIAKVPNADVLSFVFLNPMNDTADRYISSYKYMTQYTYSKYEAKAARAFIKHMVPTDTLPKISISTAVSRMAAKKVVRFKQLAAALNLARYNYLIAYQNRLATKSGASKMDRIAMLVKQGETDGLSSMKVGTQKGMKLYLLNQMNINRYLSSVLDKYEQRNNDLLDRKSVV